MLRWTVGKTIFLLAVFASTSCDSPTDPRVAPAVGPPTRISVLDCDYGSTTTTCHAEARWGELYSTTRDVTQTATWASSDSAILRVVAPGVLASGTSGDALATVTHSGISATQTFRVYTNEPPRRLCGANCVYVVQVQDAQGAPLDGVLVAITSGHLQGRSAVSSRAGARFEGDIVDGPITVRGTKAGYREWNGSGTVGGNGSAALAPVVMVPE